LRRRWLAQTVLLCLLTLCAVPTVAETHTVSLGRFGSVEIDAPDGWQKTINASASSSGPAVQFNPPGDVELILLITPIPVPEGAKRVATAVPETAEAILQSMKQVAVEMDLSIKVLEGEHCRLHYVSVTDSTVRKPTLEDFKYADQGAVDLGEIMATFTLLTNVKDAPERAVGIEIVRSMKHVARGNKSRRRSKS
jgi:hypothetical protein